MPVEEINETEQVEALLREIPKDMLESGVFYGRKKNQGHPRAKEYILTNRNGIEVINPLKIGESLGEALAFVKGKAQEGALFLLVATQPIVEDIVTRIATELNSASVAKRWLGGTLTNFKIISKRIEYYQKLKKDLAAGNFESYTKKERLEIEREIQRLEELLSGLEKMQRLPDTVIVIDPIVHATAVREAKKLHIPVVALANIDFNPDLIKYSVPGNTKSRKSIQWFLEKIAGAIIEGVAARKAAAVPEPEISPKIEAEKII